MNLNLPEVFAEDYGVSIHLAFFVSGSQLISLILTGRASELTMELTVMPACLVDYLRETYSNPGRLVLAPSIDEFQRG